MINKINIINYFTKHCFLFIYSHKIKSTIQNPKNEKNTHYRFCHFIGSL